MVYEVMSPSGVVLRRDAVMVGYTDNWLTRAVRSGFLVRIRQGAYIETSRWRLLDARQRHAVLCEAVVRQYDGGVVLSHDSAVLELGGPDHRLDLGSAHTTHLPGGGRRSAGIVHHDGALRVNDLTRVGEHWVTSPARTVLDITALRGLETGVVVADDFLRRGMVTHADLMQAHQARRCWTGSLPANVVVSLATGKSESVGETLGMLFFRKHLIAAPVQQYEVVDPLTGVVWWTDYAWPEHGLLGEFDGAGKYLRNRRPGESISDCVMREKRREDRLREITGFGMIRLDMSDLGLGRRTADRVRAALDRASAMK